VRVENKTIGKNYQYQFAVYKTNVDGTLPFSTVVSNGQVDSTLAQDYRLSRKTTRLTIAPTGQRNYFLS